ncbi:hypothetical protein COCNU_scaffold000172G000020 [Cocos nucifera]|nr:hypothetical protein [Cocos nucifera]
MLTKWLFTKKRKGKAQEDGSKRVKVSVSSSGVPASTTAAFEVIVDVKIASTTKVDIASVGLVPSMPSGPSSGDRVLELPIKKEIGEGRKKKAIVKMSYKAHLDGPDGNDNERGEDPFNNPKIVRNLVDRFAIPKVVDQMADLDPWQLIWSSLEIILKLDHQMLTHIKRVHRQEAEAHKTQEDLRAEVHHLQERVNKVEHLAEKKVADIKSLQDVLHEEEFALVRLKAALALEEERRKEAKNRVAKLETQMAKSISEAMIRAVEEFKTSSEMQNLNVKFSQEAFIKDFKFYEGRIARRFPKLDLGFLKEEEDNVEVGLSNAVVDLSFDELASSPSESTVEASKLV